MPKQDGGPAFPLSYSFDSTDHIPPGELGVPQRVKASTPGMSLRDWFAGQALNGLIAGMPGSDSKLDHSVTVRRIAKTAYDIADAMIEHKAK